MASLTAIEARDVSKCFTLKHNYGSALKVQFLSLLHRSREKPAEPLWAVRNVSLRIDRGEAVGLVGRNGSGKSTLLKLIAGVYHSSGGRILVARGARIGSLIELGVGFHGELTGQENVFINASIHGFSRPEIEAVYDSIVEYSGLRQFMDVPLKNYSSGMHMRLAFAVAATLDPDILLLDEIFAVGDQDFQHRCMKTIEQFREAGKTIIFVSHAPSAIRSICRRVCLLEQGELLYDGDVEAGLREYEAVTNGRMRGPRPRSIGVELPPPDAKAIEDAAEAPPSLDAAWHRVAIGGFWTEAGEWQERFLRAQGLEPHSFVLDVGCASMSGARYLLPYMEQSHYWGFEHRRELFEAGCHVELARAGVPPERGHVIINDSFDFSSCPYHFHFAIANSYFRRLPLNRVAQCIAAVMAKMNPGGRFYATWLDNPDPRSFRPIAHPSGLVSYPTAEPYHYSFAVLQHLCEALGYHAERLDDRSHPRGESVMVISARP